MTNSTTPEGLEDIARRAVKCKRWRWMPGMRDTNGVSVITMADAPYFHVTWFGGNGDWDVDVCHAGDIGVPDLTDAATLGCLLALVREVWNNDELYVSSYYAGAGPLQWMVEPRDDWEIDGPTEAEALVAALEAAP